MDGILHSIHTEMTNGVEVKIVFVQNRNKKRDWLAILSTDGTLSDEEIIKIYGIRWDIEVFFKTTKSLLKLQKEFQTRSYDSLISHPPSSLRGTVPGRIAAVQISEHFGGCFMNYATKFMILIGQKPTNNCLGFLKMHLERARRK
ncbi:hypothetical protein QYF49_24315 [Fictibacillus sp. CENA-BCM004]|uniref:Transposase IS4-like domain-containing protein n=1 Tax=Fictibacillus terranigra TaxID=3058424 RepID=A0ABT8EDQ5_9BACL|nr:hypothetical protein [Fictibacillus sp. CENA-BCM004]MDN4076067.1 hypothetical protein [Fictibacillus sp. CENA-BCM004]